MDENLQTEEQKLEESIKKIEAAYAKFEEEVEAARKEHRDRIAEILKQIDDRKIKELQEKLKS